MSFYVKRYSWRKLEREVWECTERPQILGLGRANACKDDVTGEESRWA